MNKYKVSVYRDGGIRRTLNGLTHCTTGPAIKWPNGHEEWWLNGRLTTRKSNQGK